MAQGRNFNVRDYCETVFTDLTSMKSKLLTHIRELEQIRGSEEGVLGSHISHFRDIIGTIDWKLEILMKACPYEWTGYTYDIEYCASVPVQDESIGKDPVVCGYLGG